jgi:beta-mannosidase
MARRFYANLLVTTIQRDGQVEVWVVSDENGPLSGEVVVETHDLYGGLTAAERFPVALDDAGAVRVASLPVPESSKRSFLVLTASAGAHTADNWHFFAPYKDYDLPVAKVHAQHLGDHRVRLESDQPALFVTLDTDGIPGVWSDNCLVLLPRRPVEVDFAPRRPISREHLREVLSVRHLTSS